MNNLLSLLPPPSSALIFLQKVSRKEVFYVFLLGLVLAILRFFALYGIAIHPDEAYYWTWSRRLDWAYYDLGPGIALYIRLFTSFLGENYLSLKLAALFPFPFWTLLLYLCARELGLSLRSRLVLLLAWGVMPVFWGGSMLILHDTGLYSAWIAAFYFSLRYIKRQENGSLYLLFLFLGIGLLFKHTMLVFVFALLLWYLFWYKKYPLFSNIHFWLSVLLCALFLLPPLIWNLKNDWGQIDAMLYHRAGTRGTPGWDKFFGGQFAAFVPFWYLAFLFLLCYVFFGTLSGKLKKLRENPKKQSLSLSFLTKIQKGLKNRKRSEEDEERRLALWHFVWISALILHIFFYFLLTNALSKPIGFSLPILLCFCFWPLTSLFLKILGTPKQQNPFLRKINFCPLCINLCAMRAFFWP